MLLSENELKNDTNNDTISNDTNQNKPFSEEEIRNRNY
jgi:hypothetical protein